MRFLFLFIFLLLHVFVTAHEGHHEVSTITWFQRLGSLHLVFLHFPIALINMLVVSELLQIRLKKTFFDDASRFLLISAAIISLPTALIGLLFSYSTTYEGTLVTFLWWHMWLGIATAIAAIGLAYIREQSGAGRVYYMGLFILFLLVNITSFFGGAMTFAPLLF